MENCMVDMIKKFSELYYNFKYKHKIIASF